MLEQKRILTVLTGSLTAMMIFCAVTPLAVGIGNAWAALIAAVAVALAAIPVHRQGLRCGSDGVETRRPWCWIISFLMNSVSGGLAAAAFYIHTEQAVLFGDLLGKMLLGVGVMCLSSLLLGCFRSGKKPVLILSAVAAVVLIVLQFVLEQGSWGAAFGLMIALFYLFADALTVGCTKRPVLRDVSFGSFGAAMLIAFAVLVVLSDGEALDGLDGLGDIGGGDSGFSHPETKKRRWAGRAG